jgi:hypothetical protein
LTPTLSDILTGNALALASLAEEKGGAEFSGAKVSVVALLSLLAAQDAERAIAVREAENEAIAGLLGISVPDVAEPTIAALDAVNADLRRLLIAFHEAAEVRGDVDADRAVLALYRQMAEGRRLVMPQLG